MPVGKCLAQMALWVLFTCCPPGPWLVVAQNFTSLRSKPPASASSPGAAIRCPLTAANEVCGRPSPKGDARINRCAPDSNFAIFSPTGPRTLSATLLKPAAVGCSSSTSQSAFCFAAALASMRASMATKLSASCPPDPAEISMSQSVFSGAARAGLARSWPPDFLTTTALSSFCARRERQERGASVWGAGKSEGGCVREPDLALADAALRSSEECRARSKRAPSLRVQARELVLRRVLRGRRGRRFRRGVCAPVFLVAHGESPVIRDLKGFLGIFANAPTRAAQNERRLRRSACAPNQTDRSIVGEARGFCNRFSPLTGEFGQENKTAPRRGGRERNHAIR